MIRARNRRSQLLGWITQLGEVMTNARTKVDVFRLAPGQEVQITMENMSVYTIVVTNKMKLQTDRWSTNMVRNVAFLARSNMSIKHRDAPNKTAVSRIIEVGEEFAVSNSRWACIKLGKVKSIWFF
jgi:hypothetical protein